MKLPRVDPEKIEFVLKILGPWPNDVLPDVSLKYVAEGPHVTSDPSHSKDTIGQFSNGAPVASFLIE